MLLVLFGVLVAFLEGAFQYYQKPDMIFNRYGIFLESLNKKAYKSINPIIRSFIPYLLKPLGLCPYCNGTWITIILYYIYFGLNLNMLFAIGLFWFFTRLLKLTKIY